MLEALESNSSAAEETWVTLTALLTNLTGFLVYLALLSGLHPALLLLVAATTAAGFFREPADRRLVLPPPRGGG